MMELGLKNHMLKGSWNFVTTYNWASNAIYHWNNLCKTNSGDNK